MARKRILIIGGGYGGLAAMRRLSRALPAERYSVLLVDETGAHTIKTRFHEIAVSSLRDFLIRFPLGPLARASGAEFLRARAISVDLDRRVVAADAGEFPYHRLILALGGETNYFGVPGAREYAVGLQTYTAASRGNRRVAALGLDVPGGPMRRAVICGAGIEGLEVAAMLRQRTPPSRLQITVVERGTELMARSQCREPQRRYVARYLERHSIDLILGSAIREVSSNQLTLDSGETVQADLVYWCSGVRPTALGGGNRSSFRVNEHLQSPEHPEVFAVGDFTTVEPEREWTNLLSAQRAIYQGELAAENLALSEQERPLRRVAFRPKGEVIALGDVDGVGIVMGVPLQGLPAAAMKKALESRYLTELYAQVPGFLLKTALGQEVKDGPT